MSTALGLQNMDQTPFLASNVDLADVGSPMQQDEDSPIVLTSREQELAAIPVPTRDELSKAGYEITERMTAFNQANYPENYSRCKQLYHFGRNHISKLLGDIPMESYEDKELWNRKAREFMLGCEEVHAWLDEQELDDEEWEDEDEMEVDKAVISGKDVKNDKDTKDVIQVAKPSDEAK